jgi:UDP-N-acetylmuramoyl-tripeptide--D-alanyl-D-alanine ligase
MGLTLEEILEAVHGTLCVDGGNYSFKAVCTDTRKIEKDCIFIALKGENFNGNKFAAEAAAKGASICIVDEISFEEEELVKGTTIIKTENTRRALMDLAKYYKSKLDVKVIGITGSTGKTSTKDLVAAALSKRYKVFKTKGNFNNEIGLPLMIFNLDESYDVAVLEMGMSNFDEIHNLADIAKPDIAIITNIGISHIENLKSRENILKAKLEITDFFNEGNILIVNGENDLLSGLNSDYFGIKNIGVGENFDYKAENLILNENSIEFSVLEKYSSNVKKIIVPVPGRHNVLNSLLAISSARILGLTYEEIQEGIVNLEATSRRLDIHKLNGYTLVDDCYNASPDSMKAAIDVITSIKGKRKLVVLGTMKELGEEAYKAHKEIGKYAKDKAIDIFISVGEFSKAYKEGFEDDSKFFSFEDNDSAANYIKQNVLQEDILLVKASRSMKFETIIEKIKI